ncbi:ArdC family protein [Photobacterium damselae subsp. piscicida]|nr:ArdC family protein [Photobacterium damselae subsp. piscicida]MDP2534272.1 ArdC family protein [Photobacterium damselae subsp. piscicida]MDP2543434.1 ArdC family protein [Photobacterium damselae subsp. piscicida]MDP2556832.1 ArdC family protein [Photobacterium damselae subsp. piscicida]MDP2570377.1 ArdC family protein [Photobacterium damselae subsp. piscicida]
MAQQPLTLTRSNTQQTTSVSPLDDESSPQNDNSQEHVNTLTNTPYSASNQALLEMHAMQFALNSHQWAGFRQWLTLGRQVKKGEKGCAIMMVCEKKKKKTTRNKKRARPKSAVWLKQFMSLIKSKHNRVKTR